MFANKNKLVLGAAGEMTNTIDAHSLVFFMEIMISKAAQVGRLRLPTYRFIQVISIIDSIAFYGQ